MDSAILLHRAESVCACNSLAVQCPEAADLWDFMSNTDFRRPLMWQCSPTMSWSGKSPDGRQWQQEVFGVVNSVQRNQANLKNKLRQCKSWLAFCKQSQNCGCLWRTVVLCAQHVCLAKCQCMSAACSSQQPDTLLASAKGVLQNAAAIIVDRGDRRLCL